jgi:hypothetical protein
MVLETLKTIGCDSEPCVARAGCPRTWRRAQLWLARADSNQNYNSKTSNFLLTE